MNSSTTLTELNLPQVEMILDEAFCIMPSYLRSREDPKYPEDLMGVAKEADMEIDQIIHRLKQVQILATGIFVNSEDIKSQDLIFDLRADVNSAREAFGSARHIHCHSQLLGEIEENLKKEERIICVAGSIQRGLSAALFLRENINPRTFALTQCT